MKKTIFSARQTLSEVESGALDNKSEECAERDEGGIEGRQMNGIEIERLLLLFVPCWFLHALHFVESRCACELD
jgi:hypothetical protein